ncbi:hypothetical protein [Serratia sp. 1D1416]|uniref:hypothetical protein n=1 Tax=Serratia sp. 1D1416 TaxID=2447890 RepID=UPI00352B2EB6
MKTTIITLAIAGALLCQSAGTVFAAPADMETTTQSFSVRLGATRVIYNPASGGTTLPLVNPQNYPILLQSEALAENMKDRGILW